MSLKATIKTIHKMRKTILTVILSMSVILCFAQDAKEQIVTALQGQQEELTKAFKDKDYRKGERLCRTMINMADTSKALSQWHKSAIKNNAYYNMACIYSLNGQKECAINAFKNAVELGYSNYKHALADPDLKNIHGEEIFRKMIRSLEEKYDYLSILKKSGKYKGDEKTAELPAFTYLAQDDPRLVNLRNTLNLDSIAGNGDEISQIKNLCLWVHNTMRHDGGSMNPEGKNALALLEVCREENRGVNCRMLATALNECYLAMGFKSRFVTCMPQDKNDQDCHVVNIVWSHTLGKWIMADPSFYAFFTDKKGNLLGIDEARAMLVEGKAVRLNPEANWNGKKRDEAYHLDYMSKNFYWFSCPVASTYDCETGGMAEDGYVILAPGDFKPWSNDYLTRNPDYFWARPE